MTNRRRISSPIQSNRRRRHHQQEENAYDDDLITKFSHSQSAYDDEYSQQLTEDEDDHYASDSASDSEPVAPNRFSSGAPTTSASEKSTNSNRKTTPSSNSASSAPNNNNNNLPETSLYVNIAPFPIFRGGSDECPSTHLSRFGKVSRANNVSTAETMMKIFPITLENEAALWYDMNVEPYYSSLTWEQMKSCFLQAYDTIRVADHMRSELMLIQQGDEESVRSYLLRLQWILKSWPEHGLPENLIGGIFVDGLREEFRDWIVPQKPSTLNEALRLAFGFEQVKSFRGFSKKKAVKCGFCDGLHEERECEVRERMREFWLKSEEENRKSGGEMGKEFARSVSTATSSGVVGMNEDHDALEGSLKKNQRKCQCGKHQCWKKKLTRNYSINVTGNPNN